jgi:hypothetical protein
MSVGRHGFQARRGSVRGRGVLLALGVIAGVMIACSGIVIPCFAQSNPLAESTSDTNETIEGTVVNSITHEPIARALVSSPDDRFATLTNSEGHFEFDIAKTDAGKGDDSPPSGGAGGTEHWIAPNRPYMLMAKKPGFLQSPYNPGKQIQENTKDVTIALTPEGVIEGTVSLPSAEPPDSITLFLYRRVVQEGSGHYIHAGQTQSTSDGQFRFADLAAGTYKLFTSELLDRDPVSFDPRGPMYGYPPVYYQNAPDFASAATIEVGAGQTQTASLSLVKQPYYNVKIPVMAEVEMGLAVNVYANGHKGPGYTLGYNPADHAIEGMLPNGTYTVEATGFGQNGMSGNGVQSITIKGARVGGPSLALAANAAIPVLVKEEFAGADQSGRMLWNIEGRNFQVTGPRRYLHVGLEAADEVNDGPQGGSLKSPNGPDDPLVMEVRGMGRYWVRVSSSRGYAASVRSGDLDLLRQPLTVGVGGAAPIEITMRDDWAQISGKVEGVATGKESAAGAQVGQAALQAIISPGVYPPEHSPGYVYFVPLPDSSGQFTQIWVGPNGNFTDATVAPGAYRLLAFDREQPQLEYRNPEAMRAYEGKGPVVRVSGGQKEQVTLQLITTDQ